MHALKNGVSNQGTDYSVCVWQVSMKNHLGVPHGISLWISSTTECMLWLTTLMSLVELCGGRGYVFFFFFSLWHLPTYFGFKVLLSVKRQPLQQAVLRDFFHHEHQRYHVLWYMDSNFFCERTNLWTLLNSTAAVIIKWNMKIETLFCVIQYLFKMETASMENVLN